MKIKSFIIFILGTLAYSFLNHVCAQISLYELVFANQQVREYEDFIDKSTVLDLKVKSVTIWCYTYEETDTKLYDLHIDRYKREYSQTGKILAEETSDYSSPKYNSELFTYFYANDKLQRITSKGVSYGENQSFEYIFNSNEQLVELKEVFPYPKSTFYTYYDFGNREKEITPWKPDIDTVIHFYSFSPGKCIYAGRRTHYKTHEDEFGHVVKEGWVYFTVNFKDIEAEGLIFQTKHSTVKPENTSLNITVYKSEDKKLIEKIVNVSLNSGLRPDETYVFEYTFWDSK